MATLTHLPQSEFIYKYLIFFIDIGSFVSEKSISRFSTIQFVYIMINILYQIVLVMVFWKGI